MLESKVKKPKKLQQDKNFTKYVGDLLVELMTDNIDEEIIDETRADDIKEPDL